MKKHMYDIYCTTIVTLLSLGVNNPPPCGRVSQSVNDKIMITIFRVSWQFYFQEKVCRSHAVSILVCLPLKGNNTYD